MRKMIEEAETNMAYHWFLGSGFHDKVPHFSTFGKNYERSFKDTDLFEHIFVDSTHVKPMRISPNLKRKSYAKKLEHNKDVFKMK
jgi:transposase